MTLLNEIFPQICGTGFYISVAYKIEQINKLVVALVGYMSQA
jgi:hypothetical protein